MRWAGCSPPVLAIALIAACSSPELIGGRSRSYWMKECTRVSFMPFWNSDKDERRHRAFRELVELGEPSVPILMELFKRDEVPYSGDALNALGMLGPKAEAAVPELSVMLEDERFTSRVALILARVGPAAKGAAPFLTRAAGRGPLRTRHFVANALIAVGPEGVAAVQQAAASADPLTREAATMALAGARLSPAVRTALDDPNPAVRAAAVGSWNARRAEADEGVKDLLRALSDPDPAVRAAARQTFTRWKQHQVVSENFMIAILLEGDVVSRQEAAWWLAPDGPLPFSGNAKAALTRALSDPDVTVRVYAARSLLRPLRPAPDLTGRLREVIEAALPLVKDDIALRLHAAESHLTLTGRAAEAQGAIAAATEKGNRFQKWHAISLAGAALEKGGDVLDSLKTLAEDKDREVSDRAVRVLKRHQERKSGRDHPQSRPDSFRASCKIAEPAQAQSGNGEAG